MGLHPKDLLSKNPRFQCSVCAKWMRLFRKDGSQRSYGACGNDGGDHLSGDGVWVCDKCCESVCNKMREELKDFEDDQI